MATANPYGGKVFEKIAKLFLEKELGAELEMPYSLDIGIQGAPKKPHKFDLGKKDLVLVECKANTWTGGDNSPSGKMSAWNSIH